MSEGNGRGWRRRKGRKSKGKIVRRMPGRGMKERRKGKNVNEDDSEEGEKGGVREEKNDGRTTER